MVLTVVKATPCPMQYYWKVALFGVYPSQDIETPCHGNHVRSITGGRDVYSLERDTNPLVVPDPDDGEVLWCMFRWTSEEARIVGLSKAVRFSLALPRLSARDIVMHRVHLPATRTRLKASSCVA